MNNERRAIYSFYRTFYPISIKLVEKTTGIEEIEIIAPTFEQWKARLTKEKLSYYKDEKELQKEYDEKIPRIPMLAAYFSPSSPFEEKWIEDNLKTVVECGFIVYDIPVVGLCLGINGYGYSHLGEEWKKLYRARDLRWHARE